MDRHSSTIAKRLSLREPQRRSLEILSRIVGLLPLKKNVDLGPVLASIQQEFPNLKDFERDFPSLCFSLATGVGKTRLMGAFISYLYLAHDIKNFFILAPNLTIYNKLIKDFTPNTSKYVFKGIAEFSSVNSPEVITGDDYLSHAGTLFDRQGCCKINIFNISKINSEVRGDRVPKIKRLSEYIGQSYFESLSELSDLVLVMDESHRYRATSGIRVINELKPVLGLELTATPFVEGGNKKVNFQNIVYDYALGQAIEDGFVKSPAVITRQNFNPATMGKQEIERLKLDDGVRLHEQTKVALETYGREMGKEIVKPFVLIIAGDTDHARQLQELIKSENFFAGYYKNKVIQVDSSQTGEKEEEMIQRLLAVEKTEEPTEIVIHVNMLKEGWDVTNLYTIIPLRAANARTLVEQSIGRGLRLPYGELTGVDDVDRLSIVAHDKFQEIVDDSKKADSPVRLKQIVLTDDEINQKWEVVTSRLKIESNINDPAIKEIGDRAKEWIYKLGMNNPNVKSLDDFNKPEVHDQLVTKITMLNRPSQGEMEGPASDADIRSVIQESLDSLRGGTIEIPCASYVPKSTIRCGFKPFNLDLDSMRFQPPEDTLWGQYLHDGKNITLTLVESGVDKQRSEDYVVSSLIAFDDVSDDNTDLLYSLAEQVIGHLRSYLSEENTNKVLRFYQQDISRFIHAQMQNHYWEESAEYDVKILTGFVELKKMTYKHPQRQERIDFKISPQNKSNVSSYIFSGFEKCLFDIQKFDSDSERQLAIILDRDSIKWFKPASSQFEIYYRSGQKSHRYEPDFVAEVVDEIYMIEVKAKNQMDDEDVNAKKEAALRWCNTVSDFTKETGGKQWTYLLIPHDDIAENMTLGGLKQKYCH